MTGGAMLIRVRAAAGRLARRVGGGQGPERRFPARPRMVFLILAVHGRSGVARATLNVASALAETHDVEIISVYSGRARPFEVDPRIAVRYLVPVPFRRLSTLSPALARKAAQPSRLLGDRLYSALTDEALSRELGRLGSGDVVVSTRPALHQVTARIAPEQVVRVGWDHFNYPGRQRPRGGGTGIRRAMPGLDAFIVLTEADRHDYRMDHPDARIEVIRNAVLWPIRTERPERDSRTVVAAGRLAPVKGFDRLVDAWSMVEADFPDWRCRIYGTGPLRAGLEEQVRSKSTTLELAGYSSDMMADLGRAELFVMSSRFEGLPMTLIEALTQGTPVVSFDCPRGPGEIVDEGNGRLVPDGDVPALAAALAELMADRELRTRLGVQALKDSRKYAIDQVAARWAALADDLAGNPERVAATVAARHARGRARAAQGSAAE
ncbi:MULTISPECIES: glycosyltransferase [Nocardioides]|uniref:Glycosyltransferase n=1 Tax=Nocardioides vastitatis TaxID=2568655 RepID=A0ABW0ZAA5_9ACTN|nr:glycosyltransferase [Nocardioides sp.]THI93489.1 glycosyltransferase family 4 protein [Nocardioides sp.]